MSATLLNMMTRVDCPTLLENLDIGSSSLLDELCELACEMTGMDAASVTLSHSSEVVLVGRYNLSIRTYRRSIFDPSRHKVFTELVDPEEQYPYSPLFNGELECFRYVARVRIAIENETVGGLHVYSRLPLETGDELLKEVMIDLGAMASEIVNSKASLKLMLRDVFALANR